MGGKTGKRRTTQAEEQDENGKHDEAQQGHEEDEAYNEEEHAEEGRLAADQIMEDCLT